MTILVGREFAPGRYEKAAVLKCSKAGRVYRMPEQLLGTLTGLFARQGASFLADERKAVEVNYEFGLTKVRVSRID